MGVYLDQIPAEIQEHVRGIAKTSGLPEGEESIELIAQGWLEKKAAFEDKISTENMREVEELAQDDTGGALVLTYSGSLLTVGPLVDGLRSVDYTSIGLRTDVPDRVSNDKSVLGAAIEVDQPAVFSAGPIKKTSAIFKIAVVAEVLEPEAEAEKLSEVTQILTEEFVEVNKTVIME
jgi:hypothetical protein